MYEKDEGQIKVREKRSDGFLSECEKKKSSSNPTLHAQEKAWSQLQM